MRRHIGEDTAARILDVPGPPARRVHRQCTPLIMWARPGILLVPRSHIPDIVELARDRTRDQLHKPLPWSGCYDSGETGRAGSGMRSIGAGAACPKTSKKRVVAPAAAGAAEVKEGVKWQMIMVRKGRVGTLGGKVRAATSGLPWLEPGFTRKSGTSRT